MRLETRKYLYDMQSAAALLERVYQWEDLC